MQIGDKRKLEWEKATTEEERSGNEAEIKAETGRQILKTQFG